MSLVQRLQDDIKLAMKSGDKARLSTLRLISAEFKRFEVDTRETLTDAGAIQLLQKMRKQRLSAIEQFVSGGREDLAEKEREEMVILGDYLPAPLSESEVNALIDEALEKVGHTVGEVMQYLKPKVAGRADGAKLAALVKAKLS